ncbi:MAG: hypothetical protein AAF590_09495 [Pseudomonadota bacterium]
MTTAEAVREIMLGNCGAIAAAIAKTNMHPGPFSLIQGDNRTVGEVLVQHTPIKAVGVIELLGGAHNEH